MNLGTVQGALAFPRWIKLSWARLLGRASLPRPKDKHGGKFQNHWEQHCKSPLVLHHLHP